MLFDPVKVGALTLPNRIVMAPMTRSRAGAGFVPQDIAVKYYAQRASAGLIVTEGTSPSPNGLGYPRIPGIFSDAQVAAWKKAEREWVDDYLSFHGRIERDDWVKQAKALAKGGEAEYIRVFGRKPR